MERPRFSEALIQRRRELGLTTAQAARVLRLKEQFIISLEEGDFEAIPKAGYAQAMVSSYARYLGLDARELVDTFQKDVARYEDSKARQNGGGSRSRSSQSSRFSSQQSVYDSSRRGLLPTSGGRAGDMGDFATTSSAQTRTNSVPLVNANRLRSTSYYDNSYQQNSLEDDYLVSQAAPRRQRRARSGSNNAAHSRSSRTQDNYLSGDNIVRSRSSFDEYEDDLVSTGATNYEPAYSSAGRRSSHRIPQAERPNNTTRKRSSGSSSRSSSRTSSRSASNARSRRQQEVGFDGILSFVSESRVIIGVVSLVIMIVLLVAIFMGVRSCTDKSKTPEPQGIPVTTTSTNTGTVSDPTTSTQNTGTVDTTQTNQTVVATPTDTTTQQVDQTTNQTSEPINAEATTTTETHGDTISIEVSISVASGESTWLEVMADGESRVADQVLGPWSETYVVTESLSVSADNTNAVSVFENGEVRSFETKASGVGTINIKVPVSNTAAEPDAGVQE